MADPPGQTQQEQPMYYQVSLIKDHSRQTSAHAAAAVRDHEAALTAQNINLYGIFAGMLGLASNEIYVVTNATHRYSLQGFLTDAGLELEASHVFMPTVRPIDHSPRTNPGIYVFRWFAVKNADVAEIVELSNAAWTSFEAGFDTQVQGLFAEPERNDVFGQMLLLTYYSNLSVWEASRDPAPAAKENFKRRNALTLEATPIATRLVL
jgi:hypothetical protein